MYTTAVKCVRKPTLHLKEGNSQSPELAGVNNILLITLYFMSHIDILDILQCTEK